MFQVELIRSITFWALFLVSAFLSVNLYVGLVQGIYNQVFMVVVAIVLEGIKVLCLTLANTARWQSAQHKINHMKEAMMGFFSRKKRKTIRDPVLLRDILDSSQQKKKAIYLYAAYVLTAFLSVAASFGYVMQTVNHATTHSIASTNTDTIAIYKDTLDQYNSQIKDNQKTITQDSNSIDQYNKLIATMDTTAPNFQQNRSVYQGNINAYQKQMAQLQQNNIDLQNKKIDLNDKIQNYKVQDIQTVKSTNKTMYQLMGEVLAVPDKTIMFILLYLLAFILEIGLFICSPHFMNKEDGEKKKITFKSVKKEEEDLEKEKRSEIPTPQETDKTPIVIEKAPLKNPTGSDEYEFIGDDYSVVKKEKEGMIQLPDLSKEEAMPESPEEFVDEADIVLPELPAPATSIVEVEEIPVRQTKSIEDQYIESLFAMGDKHYLKDKYEAAKEAGMRKYDAMQLFDFLVRAKVGAYFIVEYHKDTKQYHPNFTSEWVKAYLKQHYLPKKET